MNAPKSVRITAMERRWRRDKVAVTTHNSRSLYRGGPGSHPEGVIIGISLEEEERIFQDVLEWKDAVKQTALLE